MSVFSGTTFFLGTGWKGAVIYILFTTIINPHRRCGTVRIEHLNQLIQQIPGGLTVGPVAGIKPATSRCGVKRSIDWANPAAVISLAVSTCFCLWTDRCSFEDSCEQQETLLSSPDWKHFKSRNNNRVISPASSFSLSAFYVILLWSRAV